MLFSSLLFLYAFLPAVLFFILLCPRKWHNSILLLASLIFYAWGGVSYSAILLLSILLNYLTRPGYRPLENPIAQEVDTGYRDWSEFIDPPHL